MLRFLSKKFFEKLSFSVRPTLNRLYSSGVVKYDNESKEIQLVLDSGEVTCFPYEFLRDNCQCPLCFHETSGQSLTLLPDVLHDSDLGFRDAVFQDECLAIEWNSGHESNFTLSWLQERSYSTQRASQKGRHAIPGLQNILWGAEKKDTMQLFEFQDVMNNDRKLFQWMRAISTEGISLFKNAPKKPGQLKALAKRGFGDLFNTMYGETFTVKEKPGANNLAYTSGYLALHTDQPYYIYQPGVQFLHCISGSAKNEAVNILVDGFKVAEDLRKENPEAFEALTTLAFPYEQPGEDVYGEFIIAADKTPIGINERGEIVRISHNYPSRAQYMNYPSKETRRLYRATGVFLERMYDPKYLFEYQLEEGDILAFHNTRVLHGRTPYDATRSSRWLEGGYGNWDDLYARMRALELKLDKDNS